MSGKSHSFDPEKHAGLIVLGGSGDHADEPTAYPKEKEWIGQALRQGTPVLGICLGAQLLAYVSGGPGCMVRRGERAGEYGWKQVILTDDGKKDPVLGHLTPGCEMLLHHQDWCKLSSGAVHLADSEPRSDYSEAFRIGEMHTYGVQFHPEVTEDMLKNWLAPSGGKKKREELNIARQRQGECFPRYCDISRKLLDAWIRLALGQHLKKT